MSPSPTGEATIEQDLERLRPALTGYCYRMLGSGFEAEDATQETLVRAWRRSDTLAEPAALKSWLFRIATNVCLDQIEDRKRRARPVDLADAGSADTPVGAPLPESTWVLPIAGSQVADPDADPATQAAERESLRLAFVAALQHLPARQRVVLVLREVLRWSAQEVADLLETSVASVNSALQRARATLDELALERLRRPQPVPARRTSAACSSSTSRPSPSTTSTASSPCCATTSSSTCRRCRSGCAAPKQVGAFMLGQGAACRGSKLIATEANGCPAFAAYKPDPESGAWLPWSLTVLEWDAKDGGAPTVAGVHNFLQPFLTDLFSAFGLPERRTDADPAVAWA